MPLSIYFVLGVHPVSRSWQVLKAFKSLEKALDYRDEMNVKAVEIGSSYQYLVQSTELVEE